MPQTRKSAQDRKAEIAAATLRLLTTTPIERLSTSQIANEIGITQAAIFRHFPTKDALWLAVLEAVEARATARWDNALEKANTPLARLRALLRAQLLLIAETPSIPVLIFNAGRITSESTMRPVHLRVLEGLRRRAVDQLRAAQNVQEIAGPSPEDSSDLLLGLLQGAVFRWRMSACRFDLVSEGMRLVDIQLGLIAGHSQRDTHGQGDKE